MSPSLLSALCCPNCHGALTLVRGSYDADGALRCAGCAREFVIEGGLPILADRAYLDRICDRWPGGTGIDTDTARVPRRSLVRQRAASPAFAQFLERMATLSGLVVDVASGPGGSYASVLVPRLAAGTSYVLTDAAIGMLKELQAAWAGESEAVELSFLGLDANRFPFRDDSVDAITSHYGFGAACDDPERSRPPLRLTAHREAYRMLRPGGLAFDLSFHCGEGTRSAAWLESLGCEGASRTSLESAVRAIGFEVLSADVVEEGRGKLCEGDMMPLDENDTWVHVAYLLRKP